MAVMTDTDRWECWADFMRTEKATIASLSKSELRAALDAADLWASNNAASFNTAIPQPARNALTAAQKARLLAWVILKRYNVGV